MRPMSNRRLISIAAGVSPELEGDPSTFVEVAARAGWEGTGVWFDPSTWTDKTTSEVRKRVEDTGLTSLTWKLSGWGQRATVESDLLKLLR